MTPRQKARARRAEDWLCLVNRPAVFALLAISRRLGDVVRVPGIGCIVNDADTARAILLDEENFNSHERGSFGHMITRVLGPRALINMDGQDHRRLKRLLLDVFSARYVRTIMEQATGDLTDRLKTDLAAGRTVDFAAFMRQYGGAMACALVGVEVDKENRSAAHDEIFWLATEIMSLAGVVRRTLSPADDARARTYVDRLHAYIRKSYDSPSVADHSVTQMLRAQGLGFDEVKGLVTVVMIGATELIIYGLPRIFAVLVDSGALPVVADEPTRLDQAIDEGFRVVTPSTVILRAVTRDCSIGRHRFVRGDRVLIAFRNIMRQRAHFADPDHVDLERAIPASLRRLPFGAGAHMCLGTSLALAETRHVLGILTTLGGRFEILERARNRGKIYPGYARLMIRRVPAGAPSAL